MITSLYKFGLLVIVLSLLLSSGCSPDLDFDHQLRKITRPYRFDLITWEIEILAQEAGGLLNRRATTENATLQVAVFVANVQRIKQLESDVVSAAGDDYAPSQVELEEIRKQNMDMAQALAVTFGFSTIVMGFVLFPLYSVQILTGAMWFPVYLFMSVLFLSVFTMINFKKN